MADEEDRILADARKLPYAERVVHKNWKARSEAYEGMQAACERALSDEDECFAELAPCICKAIADSNVAALDKGLDATLAYLGRANKAQASRVASPLCSAIVKQNLKQRPGTVKRCTNVCLALIELEQSEHVLEYVIKGFGDKVPKAAAAALDIVSLALSEFGHKVVPPQPLLKALPAMFDAKQPAVRDAVKKLMVELASWLGADVVRSMLLAKMPDAMRKDTEKLVEEAPRKQHPARLTRKEAAARARTAAVDGSAGGAGTPGAAAGLSAPQQNGLQGQEDSGMDAYDFAEPVDILPRLDKGFWEGLAAAKWTERRDALRSLRQLAAAPRLAPGDYADVVRELRKIIVKDSNVVCVADAAGCLGALALGLRREFAATARALFSVLLDKMKDKNTNVCAQSGQALAVFHRHCMSLADAAEDLAAAMGHKNPKLKLESLKLLQGCVEASTKDCAAKAHSALLPAAASAANDPTPAAREAALEVLAAFARKAGSMRPVDKYADKLDDSKKKRLDEIMKGARTAPAPGAASSGAPVQRHENGPSTVKPLSPKDTNSQTARGAAPKKVAKPGAASNGGSSSANQGIADDDDAGLQTGTLSRAEVEEKLSALAGEALVQRLQSSAWKERLEAMQTLTDLVLDQKENLDAAMLIQALSHLPGWAEKNFQVLAKAFQLIQGIAECDAFALGKKEAFTALQGLVPKLTDTKLKGPACEALSALSEAVGPQFVCAQVHKQAGLQKNPKVLAEALAWMATAVEAFGLAALDVKLLIDWMRADLASSNAGVRNGAIALLGTAHRQLGPGLAPMLAQHVKPALMATLEAAFKANPVAQVVPMRKVRGRAPAGAGPARKAKGASAAAQPDEAPAAALDPQDLLPRADISGAITPNLADRFGSAKWQERNAALEEVDGILRGAGGRVQPGVGNLIPLLKARLADTNANLVGRALVVAADLARAMGPPWDKSARDMLKAAVECLADKKKPVRDGVVTLMEAWVSVSAPDRVIPVLADYLGTSRGAGAEGKAASLRWAASAMGGGKGRSCIEAGVRAATCGTLDKGVEAREAGGALLTTLVQVYGKADVSHAVNALSGGAKKAAGDALHKALSSAAASKADVPALDVAAVASYAISVSCETSPTAPAPQQHFPAAQQRASVPAQQPSTAPATSRRSSAAGTQQPSLALSHKKEERAKRGRNKPSKFEPPSESDEEALVAELGPLASDKLRVLLFAKDFQKHVEAAELLLAELPAHPEHMMASLDLLLRWAVVRMCDPRANTTCQLKVLELTRALLEAVEAQDRQLSAHEAACILPCIVEKAGSNADRIRAQHREVLRLALRVHPAPRLVEYLAHGLGSKSARTRVEAIEALGEILAAEGLAPFERARDKPFPAIAQMVSDRDKGMRAAALAILERLHAAVGAHSAWSLLGPLKDQQRSLIEERIRHRERHPDAPVLADAGAGASTSYVSHWLDSSAPSSRSSPRSVASARPATSSAGPEHAVPASPRFSVRRALSSPDELATGQHTHSNAARAAGQHLSSAATPVPAATPATAARRPPGGAAPPPRLAFPPLQPPLAQQPSGSCMLDAVTPLGPAARAGRQASDAEAQRARWDTALRLLAEDRDEHVYIEGLKLLFYELMDAAKRLILPEVLRHYAETAGHVVQELVRKVQKVFKAAAEPPMGPARPCKYALNALMQAFLVPELAGAVPLEPLREVVATLLLRMLCPDTLRMPEGINLLKGLNVLSMRVLENSDRNLVFVVLVQLLSFQHEELADEAARARYSDLVVKCLIKVSKTVGHMLTVDEDTGTVVTVLDLPSILMALHTYFTGLGYDEIRRLGAANDKALRMAKTLLHELCKHAGHHITSYMRAIPQDTEPAPIIWSYVDLNLQTLGSARLLKTHGPPPPLQLPSPSSSHPPAVSPSTQPPAEEGTPPAAGPGSQSTLPHSAAPATQAPAPCGPDPSCQVASDPAATAACLQAARLLLAANPNRAAAPAAAADCSTTVHSPGVQNTPANLPPCPAPTPKVRRGLLAAIFKKIGDKDNSQAGLDELYQFQLDHPDVDIAPHIASVSESFKSYITHGLRKAARRHEAAAAAPPQPAPACQGSLTGTDPQAASSTALDVAELRARFQRIKAG